MRYALRFEEIRSDLLGKVRTIFAQLNEAQTIESSASPPAKLKAIRRSSMLI